MAIGTGTALLVGAGAGLLGAKMQSGAAKDAAQASAAGTEAGIFEQRRQFDLTREDTAPYRQAGVNALTQLQGDINSPVTSADVMADPGYQFGMEQGQRALDRKIAAMGGRVSGAAIKAATRYGTDYASTGFNAAYQRRQDRLNRLAAIAGIGQTGTNASAQAGQNSANAISSLVQNRADTQAAGGLAQANIWGNAANQLGGLAMKGSTPPPPNIGTSIGQTAATGAMGYTPSDSRLKTNVTKIGTAANGLPLYRYRYVWGGPEQIGHMAHEVAAVFPDAVAQSADGFLMVDYSKV